MSRRDAAPDATLDDVLDVVGCRGDREDERRGVSWVLREDPPAGQTLTVATRRLLERVVPLRGPLAVLRGRGFTVRVLIQQAPGDGHVVPAGLFAEAAAWGGAVDVDQFTVVDCADTDPARAGIFLEADAVAAHAATGTDLLVGGYGTPEPAADPGWVLPWRGRVVDELGAEEGYLQLGLDDGSVLECTGDLVPEELGLPRPRRAGPARRLRVVDSAVVWPGWLRVVGEGLRVEGTVTEVAATGPGFTFAGGVMSFHDVPAPDRPTAVR
ncbi:hypothetical protein [Kineococcus sp. SYSU DK002]|uniref:hypothetical protein n=1 Tax=Kineococcus sp. SYSU DK002 TaxID=3383123 RepID=UPI003D7D70E0